MSIPVPRAAAAGSGGRVAVRPAMSVALGEAPGPERLPVVLVVEDSKAEAALALAALRRSGLPYPCEVAETVAAALSVLQQRNVVCVLLDLGLPDADGLTALEALRGHSDVPVVVLTGRDDEELAVLALACGAQDYVFKGRADGELLFRTVRYAVERHRAERRVREGHELAQAVLDAMEDHIAVLDASGTIVSTNVAWDQFAAANGGDPGRCGVGTSYLEVCRRAGESKAAEAIEAVLGGRLVRDGLEYTCHVDAVRQWFEMRVTPVDLPSGRGAVVSHVTITDLKQAQERLSELARQDPLTGLVNRGTIIEAIGDALAAGRGSGSITAVIFVDLDRFKAVNDSLGHAQGDQVIREAARRIHAHARAVDTVARFGGDEFVVVCANVRDEADALVAAERLRGVLAEPFDCDGEQVTLGASIGLAFARYGDEDPQQLLDDADTAMYQAKDDGRNQVRVFAPHLREGARRRFHQSSALRDGLRLGQLEVHYQPVCELQSGDLVGVEALVRWRVDDRLVPPGEFIPLAEQSQLITELDQFVLDSACRDAARWIHDHQYSGTVAVNLSAVHLRAAAGLVPMVSGALGRSGLPPERLVLEVTETALISEPAKAAKELSAVRELGVHVAVDDFGTGYSSLANLKHLPVDVLKIDRSFVAGLGHDVADTAIVRSVIELANALSLQVIAEGIEDDQQRQMLHNLGCGLGQGYLWSPAICGRELHEALRRGHL